MSNAFRIGVEAGLADALALLDWQTQKRGVDATVADVRYPIERQHELIRRGNLRREKAR